MIYDIQLDLIIANADPLNTKQRPFILLGVPLTQKRVTVYKL